MDAEVTSYLSPFVASNNFSGAVLIAHRGQVRFSAGFGFANREHAIPATAASRFHIASLSKALTAVAILLLRQRGLLATTDTVARYRPAFRAGTRITLDQLLRHSSGIPNINALPAFAQLQRFPQTPQSLLPLLDELPLENEPGARYRYSNSNYLLLAAIIEAVSGRSYGEFLAEAIFRPLGMEATLHDGDAAALIPARAAGYIPRGSSDVVNAPFIDFSSKVGSGSIVSTTGDLFRFSRALQRGDLLRPETIAEMFTQRYGWFVAGESGARITSLSGRVPGFVAGMRWYEEEDRTVIALSNIYVNATQQSIMDALAAIARGEHYEPVKTLTPMAITAAGAMEIGTYVGGKDFLIPHVVLTVEGAGDCLRMQWSSGAESTLIPVASGEYLDRSFWARVRFEHDAHGATTALVWEFDGKEHRAARVQSSK